MQRFFVSQIINNAHFEITDPEQVKQITAVLRYKVGDRILLLDNSGYIYESEISILNKKSVFTQIVKKERGLGFEKDVNLYCALLKKENFELVLQKAVELGVKNIFPVLNERCVKDSISPAQYFRMKEIIKEAVEQSEGAILPTLHDLTTFSQALLRPKDLRTRLIASERNGLNPISVYRGANGLDLFIGPEGGFSNTELLAANGHGIIAVSLGRRILRAETAAIAALGALLLP